MTELEVNTSASAGNISNSFFFASAPFSVRMAWMLLASSALMVRSI